MGNLKRFLSLGLVIMLAGIVFAQDAKIISHVENRSRIVRAWNSIGPATTQWNQAMSKVELLLQARFDPRVVNVNPALEDERRHACVANYKTAREALLKRLDALNELIEEEDY